VSSSGVGVILVGKRGELVVEGEMNNDKMLKLNI
jgi:hypothetical protein